jgi:hypothetical protein
LRDCSSIKVRNSSRSELTLGSVREVWALGATVSETSVDELPLRETPRPILVSVVWLLAPSGAYRDRSHLL